MPVLTTTSKNFYNPKTAYIGNDFNQDVFNKVNVKPNTTYTFYANGKNWLGCILYDKNDNQTRVLSGSAHLTKSTFTTTENEVEVLLSYYTGKEGVIIEDVDFTGVQLEIGAETTSYEPYKTNILSTPEDLELRGIGDVKDTLDLTTGEVVQNIYEFTLDGSQNIDNEGDLLYYYLPFGVHNNRSNSDKLPSITVGQFLDGLTGVAPQNRGNSSRVYIKVNGITTKEEMKNFFLNNPTTIQCILETPTIKTVDLSCINENNVECDFIPIMDTMHYQTSSDTIPPLVDLTVCVEATTQNLASFVKLEGIEGNE